MGDLVNLRQVRKRKQRNEKAKKADENRVLHGRTRHERDLNDARKQSAGKHLDGHRRDDPDASNPSNAPNRPKVSDEPDNADATDAQDTVVKDHDADQSPQPSEAALTKSRSDETARDNVVSIFGHGKPGNDPA
ncbi:DUF4169 family protein [Thalassospira povalilytica]|uniref:DUF4169 domain-containing protein n=1 Tax=Thalassospira povalilytica TaxID=732237 RepID=A0ABX4R7D5_9PROT|nr:DUF4169 family protein [Thalassospira povalilytica]PKR49119.1 hypothetical protein CU041_11635 [Thalassospira povalilytica]